MADKEEAQLDPLYFQLFEFTPKKGDLKRIEIIQAAIECISQVGIEGMTFEAIGKLIGVKPSHIAYYFPDKTDIVDAMFKFMVGSMQRSSVEAIRTQPNPRKRFEAYVESWFHYIKENPTHRPLVTLFYYYCSRFETYQKLNQDLNKSGTERIAAMIAPLLPEGKTARETFIIAEKILGVLHGKMLRFLTVDQSPAFWKQMKKEALERTTELALNQGVQP